MKIRVQLLEVISLLPLVSVLGIDPQIQQQKPFTLRSHPAGSPTPYF